MLQLALARIRQLSAHEIGHTIGLAHNFAASAVGRESVMDYPAPLATAIAGFGNASIDVSDAYGVGLGAWDVQAVRYGYTPEASQLPAILRENRERGLLYISDYDARPSGAASPTAALWDNGTDAVQSLRDEMAVRRIALDRFSEATIRDGRPLATLEEVLVPLYLRHRYQVEATAHLVGGVNYAYTARGDGAAAPEVVPAPVQRAALDALLATLAPSELVLPPAALAMIPPRPPGYYDGRERFDRRTGVTLDPIAPAETAARMVFSFLLDRERAARLAYQADLAPQQLSLQGVMESTQEALISMQASGAYEQEVRRTVMTVWAQSLIDLASDRAAAPAVRARSEATLRTLHARFEATAGNGEYAVHRTWLAGEIGRFLDREYDPEMAPRPVRTPPGSPIGGE